MLRFFKVNDPYSLLLLFVVMIILRVPFYWNGIEAFLPDLNYMIIGERLASGNRLYQDVLVNVEPFSAGFFAILHWCFGKSIITYHIIGFVLMFVQAMLFNQLTLANKVYTEKNYLPAVIYVILMSISVDMFAVNPIMLANTFILIVMNSVFRQVEFRVKRDEEIFNIGIYLGIASLFYFPAILYGFISLLCLALFSATILRRYLLILYGLILPFLLIETYYFSVDISSEVGSVLFNYWFQSVKYRLDQTTLFTFSAVPILCFLIAILRIAQGSRFSNHQSRIAQMMFLWLLVSLLLLLKPSSGMSDFIIFVPAIAYFITHLFIVSRKRILAEIIFFLFVVMIIGLSYASYFGEETVSKYISYQPLTIKKNRYNNLLAGQKIWVIGNDLSLYSNSKLASKFYQYEIYANQFLEEENYLNLATLVYKDIIENKPDVIIDQLDIMPKLLINMPVIKSEFEVLEKGIYLKKGYKLKYL